MRKFPEYRTTTVTPCQRLLRSPKVKTKKQAKKLWITFAIFAARFSPSSPQNDEESVWRYNCRRRADKPTDDVANFLTTPLRCFSHLNKLKILFTFRKRKRDSRTAESDTDLWSRLTISEGRIKRGLGITRTDSCSSNFGIKEDVFRTHVWNEFFLGPLLSKCILYQHLCHVGPKSIHVLLYSILTVQTRVPLLSVCLGRRARFGALPSFLLPLAPFCQLVDRTRWNLRMRPKIYVGHEMCESPEEVFPDSPMKLDTGCIDWKNPLWQWFVITWAKAIWFQHLPGCKCNMPLAG